MIYIASDHGGYLTKLKVISLFEKHQIEFKDLGTNSTDSVDYPDFAKILAENVLQDKHSVGILICRTGIGMSIAANRYKGIRAALCRSKHDAVLARQHNNANVLVIKAGGCCCKRKAMIQAFLNTPFEGGRHAKRVQKLDEI